MQVSPEIIVNPETFISDLDRCEHGRHAADPCFSCEGGQSRGNPTARDELCFTEAGEVVIGFSLGASHAYVLSLAEDCRRGAPKVKMVPWR